MTIPHSNPSTTPTGNKTQVRKLHRSALVQKLLLTADFLLTLLSESQQRHTFFIVMGCFGFQLVLLVANVIQLVVLFTNTYAFRAGMVVVMAKEFKGTLGVYCVYALLFLVTRGLGGFQAWGCYYSKCDIWTTNYISLYTFFRFAQIAYYFATLHASYKICDPKYYKDSAWLRRSLRHAT